MTAPHPRLDPVAPLAAWQLALKWGTEEDLASGEVFLGQPAFEHRAAIDWREGLPTDYRGSMTVRLDRFSNAAGQLLADLERFAPETPHVELQLLLPGEPLVLFAGRLAQWRVEANALVIEATRAWPWDPQRTLCRDLSQLPEGIALGIGASAWLPQVFGEARAVEATPLFRDSGVRNARAIGRADTAIDLVEMPPWPAAGRVQIDDEVIDYAEMHTNPPRIARLVRSFPREHAARRLVRLLPAGGVRWIAADHPATVDLVRATAPDGDIVEEIAVESDMIDGREAIVLRREDLPVTRRHATFVNENALAANASDWTIDAETTCLDPQLAFHARTSDGARFERLAPLLKARWSVDFRRTPRRHDRLVRVQLAFEFAANPFWRLGTQLAVRLVRGARTLEHTIDYPAPHDGTAAFRGTATGTLAGAWIEAALGRRVLGSDPLIGEPLSFAVEGEVNQSLPFHPVTIDFTAMIEEDGERGWTMFNPGTPGLDLVIELRNPSQFLSVAVRNVHWRLAVHPATQVSADSRLFADVRGRLAGDDGNCAPGEVLAELLLGVDFAALDPQQFDTDSLESIAAFNVHFRRRFGAAFRGPIALDEALRAALAESATLLAPDGAGWKLLPLEAESGIQPALEIGDGDVLENAAAVGSIAAPLRARTLELIRRDDGETLGRMMRPAGHGTARWTVTWLRGGHESLADLAFRRFGNPIAPVELPLHAGWMALSPGEAVRLSTRQPHLADRRATVLALRATQDGVAAAMWLHPARLVCWSDGDAAIWREVAPPRLVLQIAGRVAAEFHPGELRLRGVVREFHTIAPLAAGPARDGEGNLVLSVHGGESSAAIIFSAGGDLLLPADAVEHAALAGSAPACAWSIDGEALALGTPELGVVALIDTAAPRLLLAGRIREQLVP